jgi:hypothetical protein
VEKWRRKEREKIRKLEDKKRRAAERRNIGRIL